MAMLSMTTLMQSAGFDYIVVETVGVGQSEVEIASLADTTVVVLVPEAGDEVQMIKAGVLEIADIFVVTKADLRFPCTSFHRGDHMYVPDLYARVSIFDKANKKVADICDWLDGAR